MSKEKQRSTTTDTSFDTTFDTWGRVAEEQLDRFNNWSSQVTQMQLAAIDQFRDLVDYSSKLSTEWQKHAMETSRKIYGQLMPQR